MNNKRNIIICAVLAVLLLCGIGYLFHSLFFSSQADAVSTDRLTDGVEAVPSDAIFLLETGSFSDIMDMTDGGSALGRLAGSIPPEAGGWEAALSMLYVSKNTVSPLLVLSIPEKTDAGTFMQEILDECGGVVDKRYGPVTVHKAAVPDASFALFGHFLIASPSLVAVESSLRHLENGTSIKDNPFYSGIPGVTSDDGILHVSFANLGKIFSGAASRKYIGYASFFQSMADWGAFGLSYDDAALVLDGRFMSVRAGERYSDVLLSQRGRKPQVYSVVPSGASWVLTLPFTSAESYLNAYGTYVAADGRKKDYDYINALQPGDHTGGVSTYDFAKSLDLRELAVFSCDMAGEGRKIMAMRAQNPGVLGGTGDSLCSYSFRGYIPSLFGEVFRPSSEDYYCVLGEWVLVGGEEELSYLRNDWRRGTFFSLEEYLEQTPASDELREISCLSLLVNTGRCADTLAGFLKEPYSSYLRNRLGKKNFELTAVNMYRLQDALGVRISCYAEDMTELPRQESSGTALVEDVRIQVPSGPFKVRNFIDGSTNWLEQMEDYDLRLLNSSRRPVWTVSFSEPLCGTVRQIDYLKNNKLQMLFGAGDRIWLLDRLGRKVGRFPISLGKEILLGPDVYDFNGDKNYTLMVLHADNTLVQYDIDGRRVPGWNTVSLAERIIALPELLEAGGKNYWVVRTSYQTLIYDARGMVCADFSKKRRLSRDSAVEPVSSREVAVTTSDGRSMLLDLEDGSFRKR